jgi:hypothetical protein
VERGLAARKSAPVPLKTSGEPTAVLRRSRDAAKFGGPEKLEGFARLDRFARAIEQRDSPDAYFEAIVAHERAISPSLGKARGASNLVGTITD